MKVAVVAEYYPRAYDPVLGVWAHRQALAARDAGAQVHVFVLHRPIPPKSALRSGHGLLGPLRQPLSTEIDGLPVSYVPFLAPPRGRSYGRWGAWAAPALRRALRRAGPDLVHAHYAAPAGDAVRRAMPELPLVISVHGGDLLAVPDGFAGGRNAVTSALAHCRLVLANSAGMEARARALGAREARVVHLGTDLPDPAPRRDHLVSVGHLVARKRHADVLRAMWALRTSHPELRYVVVGDGPERPALERLARELGLAVDFCGQLAPDLALAEARRGAVFVLPSVQEAFGVAYIEAMAGGVPAVACRGEDGPEEIARCGGGIVLVAPGDPEALAAELRRLLDDTRWRTELSRQARDNVAQNFTWERCGAETVAAYERVLSAPAS